MNSQYVYLATICWDGYDEYTEGEYTRFMIDSDENIKKDVLMFNMFDLYSKEDDININDDIKKYYDELLDEYFLDDLYW